MSDSPPAGAPLRLFNSLTRQLEEFHPVHPGEARVYSCGPTVYNYPHIGNMRAYIFADVLGRTLSWKGYDLTHVINITDVGHLTDDADAGEDKLEKAAAERAQSIWDIARHYTEAFKDDVKALNIRQPSQWTIATDYVPKMIEFAKSIEAHCYEIESGLYFDTSTVAHYGQLAGRHMLDRIEDEVSAWLRIGETEGKRNWADFAIWRKTPPGETRQMEWDSPWGRGAPGWHLECSVMSGDLLGFPFDIHTGGIDHREIHHPNEIAQNQAFCHSDASGANIWMHNNFLVERSGKMSKSAGKFLRLQLLIDKGYHPLAYRLMCLQAHYRSELEFSWEGLSGALTRYARLILGVEKLRQRGRVNRISSVDRWAEPYRRSFEAAMCDDLNTPNALVALEKLIAHKTAERDEQLGLIADFDDVLGLNLLSIERAELRLRPIDAVLTETEVETFLAARRAARANKDYAESDRLRDELLAKGVHVMDGGVTGMEFDWVLEFDR